jgi:hypothetical protein
MDASSKNSGQTSGGRFASALSAFFGYFLDSRLRRSPFGPASPFAPQAAQCAKESNSRTQREKVPSFTRKTSNTEAKAPHTKQTLTPTHAR